VPRASAAAINVISIEGLPPRGDAPRGLSKAERALFDQIVKACDPRHFVESDGPLLVSYVQATLMSRQTAGDQEQIYGTATGLRQGFVSL
jgi:hypothetical protein